MGLKEILSTYLLDIVIVIVSLATLIGASYKPTHRYVRGLVGLIVAAIVVVLIKNVEALNFIEFYVHQFFQAIRYEEFMKYIFTISGKEYLIETNSFEIVYNLSMLGIIGLVVFVIVNLIMGLRHSNKIKKHVKLGHYVYNKPLCSFLLAFLLLAIGLVGTSIFLSLNFEKNYTETSLILYNIYINIENIVNNLSNSVSFIKPMDFYIDMISNIELGSFQ